jgi:hypothetical protein
MIERADGPLLRVGRITCEAPFRYDRCMFSFDGDGGRRDCECCVEFAAAHGSGDAEWGGGVRIGGLGLASDSASTWKNLLSTCDLPVADKGGDGA